MRRTVAPGPPSGPAPAAARMASAGIAVRSTQRRMSEPIVRSARRLSHRPAVVNGVRNTGCNICRTRLGPPTWSARRWQGHRPLPRSTRGPGPGQGSIRIPKGGGMSLKKRRLGKSDLEITAVGFGAWATGGGGWAFGWGPQDDNASLAAIRRALALGVNWIDTAAVYGLGHSEELLGRALRDLPAPERPYVFTKCGLQWDAKNPM